MLNTYLKYSLCKEPIQNYKKVRQDSTFSKNRQIAFYFIRLRNINLTRFEIAANYQILPLFLGERVS